MMILIKRNKEMRVDLIRLIFVLLCLVPERMQIRLETGSNNHLKRMIEKCTSKEIKKTVDLYKQSLIDHCHMGASMQWQFVNPPQ
jgi:hypothetical protein